MFDFITTYLEVPFKRDSLESYYGPERIMHGIPKDVGVSLDFPKGIKSSENKLIYALWREGVVPDYNLRVLSDLSANEFKAAIDKLLKDEKIIETSYEDGDNTKKNKQTKFYSLAK